MVKAISLYGTGELRQAIKRTDLTLLESFIRFLENDPIEFGSGYSKEIVWRYIRRYPLNDEQIHRLEEAAFKCLARPMTPEFKFMCLTMSHLATDAFWKRVEGILEADNPIVQINAYCLFAYSKGIYAGEKQRLEMKKVKFQLFVAYYTYHHAYSVEDLVALIQAAENWPDGEVRYRQPVEVYMPIFNFDNDLIATFDLSMSKKDVVFRNLGEILSTGVLHPETVDAWVYAIFLLGQLDYPEAVGLLIDFMNQKLDFMPNSYYKKMPAHMLQRVLNYYGTPEALEAVKQLESITQNHCYARIEVDHTNR
ncbi:MAG: hypothetical protein GC179_05810 [Anaerolineaceae bacterium]|nr:hypothetical protein [Anaerolineaceae bacterium]